MGKKTIITGGYVHLDLRRLGDFGVFSISGKERNERELKTDLEKLCSSAIKRLDKFDDEFGGASIVYEKEDVCEHCGWAWAEAGDSPHNGGCCDEDYKVYKGENHET